MKITQNVMAVVHNSCMHLPANDDNEYCNGDGDDDDDDDDTMSNGFVANGLPNFITFWSIRRSDCILCNLF